MSKSKKTPEQEEETKGKATAAPEEDSKPAEENGSSENRPCNTAQARIFRRESTGHPKRVAAYCRVSTDKEQQRALLLQVLPRIPQRCRRQA